jgi:hypothetical protein
MRNLMSRLFSVRVLVVMALVMMAMVLVPDAALAQTVGECTWIDAGMGGGWYPTGCDTGWNPEPMTDVEREAWMHLIWWNLVILAAIVIL